MPGGVRETSDRAPSRETLRILIADDQDLVRSGFRMILNSYDGLSVEGEARNGEEAVYLAQKIRPDVVLMDIRMPVRNGIDATRDITSNPLLTGTHVLVLTTFDIDEYVYDALAAGASGFLLKDAEPTTSSRPSTSSHAAMPSSSPRSCDAWWRRSWRRALARACRGARTHGRP